MPALGKEPGKFRLLKHVLAWRNASQLAEIPDEVRLIGKAAGGRGARAWRRIRLIQHRERVLKSRDPGQALRRHADDVHETPFEMPRRQPHGRREITDRDHPARPSDALDDVPYARVGNRLNDPLERGLQVCDDVSRIVRRVARRLECPSHYRSDVRDGGCEPSEAVLRFPKKRRRSIRPEPDPHHSDPARWTQHELARKLTGKENGGLTFVPAAGVHAIERIRQVQNQF